MKRYLRRENWLRRLVEFAVAIAVVAAVGHWRDWSERRAQAELPASAWFLVNEIYVPDHPRGSNPAISFDRFVRVNFTGFRVVEVQKQTATGLFSPACSGSSLDDYHAHLVGRNTPVSWEELIGEPCVVPTGRYRLRVSWKLRVFDYPEKNLVAYSNLFYVTP